jgi:hypothetical protein
MDPLDLGGEDSIRNALVCCASCNNKKWKKSFLYWLEQLSPGYKKLAREIYIEKHEHSPEEFVKGDPTTRIDTRYELLLDEEELKEMYLKPIVDGPPSNESITITISIDNILKKTEIQKLLQRKNKNNKNYKQRG